MQMSVVSEERHSYGGWTSAFDSEQDERPAVYPETSGRREMLSAHPSTERHKHTPPLLSITVTLPLVQWFSNWGPRPPGGPQDGTRGAAKKF